jgi:hypothetical protein
MSVNTARTFARPALKKKVMDVEDVLSWAYRDELPKKHSSDGGTGYPTMSTISPMFRIAAFGGPIDNWSREPGFPAAVGDPHPDALLIEAAVARLERFHNHRFSGPLGLADDLEGFSVDEQAAVRHALPGMIGLVMVHAKLRNRPPWETQPTPRPVLADNHAPVVLRMESVQVEDRMGTRSEERPVRCKAVRGGKVPFYPQGAYSPLKWEPGPAAIVRERAEYAVWWAALDALAADLSGQLSTISVIAPSAPRRPWTGERELGKPSRVLESTTRTYARHEVAQTAADRLQRRRRIAAPDPHDERRASPVRIIYSRAIGGVA